MNAAAALPEWLVWLVAISAVSTPFILLWINLSAASRKQLMQDIKDQLAGAGKEFEKASAELKSDLGSLELELKESRRECREDIRSVVAQLSEYPRRQELTDAIDGLRNAMRELRNDINRR